MAKNKIIYWLSMLILCSLIGGSIGAMMGEFFNLVCQHKCKEQPSIRVEPRELPVGANITLYGNWEPGPDDPQIFLDIENVFIGDRRVPQIRGVYYSTERIESLKNRTHVR